MKEEEFFDGKERNERKRKVLTVSKSLAASSSDVSGVVVLSFVLMMSARGMSGLVAACCFEFVGHGERGQRRG